MMGENCDDPVKLTGFSRADRALAIKQQRE